MIMGAALSSTLIVTVAALRRSAQVNDVAATPLLCGVPRGLQMRSGPTGPHYFPAKRGNGIRAVRPAAKTPCPPHGLHRVVPSGGFQWLQADWVSLPCPALPRLHACVHRSCLPLCLSCAFSWAHRSVAWGSMVGIDRLNVPAIDTFSH